MPRATKGSRGKARRQKVPCSAEEADEEEQKGNLSSLPRRPRKHLQEKELRVRELRSAPEQSDEGCGGRWRCCCRCCRSTIVVLLLLFVVGGVLFAAFFLEVELEALEAVVPSAHYLRRPPPPSPHPPPHPPPHLGPLPLTPEPPPLQAPVEKGCPPSCGGYSCDDKRCSYCTACLSCSTCTWAEYSGEGKGWKNIGTSTSTMFKNGCYTLDAAKSILEANDGHWPGVDDYKSDDLPGRMSFYPTVCFTLPEGMPCYEQSGEYGEPFSQSTPGCPGFRPDLH